MGRPLRPGVPPGLHSDFTRTSWTLHGPGITIVHRESLCPAGVHRQEVRAHRLPSPACASAFSIGSVLVVVGCTGEPTTASWVPGDPPRWSQAGSRRPHHADEYLAEIADRVPGFAGVYVRHDTLLLRLKNLAGDGTKAAALRQVLRQDPDLARFRGVSGRLADGPVVVESSPYDARELWEYRVRVLQEVFGGGGVHRLDQDETRGVIRIGIDASTAPSEVAARVAVAGIPSDAVLIEVRERAHRQTTLQDRMRPVPGRVRIEIENGGTCTLTANAFRSEGESWGFLTNSHCTSEFGAAYGDAAYQNKDSTGNTIGWEVLDPSLWDAGVGLCPSGIEGCRYTDAAYFVYESSSYPDSMTIARTTSSSGGSTISSSHPRFHVSGPDIEYPALETEVHKVGRATGWTHGEVIDTCEDVLIDYVVTFCAYVTDYENDEGDSGAPVFTWDGSSDTVELIGMHFGGNGSEGLFSPWLFIMIEIDGELQDELILAY